MLFKTLKTTLEVGLAEPVRILQVSDCHLSNTDERDSEKAREKCAKKSKAFLDQSEGISLEDRLTEVLKLGEFYDITVFTGDVIDCPSKKNMEILSKALENANYLYTFGNHDYYSYDSDHGCKEDLDKYVGDFRAFLTNEPLYDSWVVKGLNLVVMDNSLGNFSSEQVKFMEDELNKGLPTLLFVHLPIYSPTFIQQSYTWWESVMCVGAPEDVLKKYGEWGTNLQPTPETEQMLKLLGESNLLKGIFASHLHFKDRALVLGDKPQYISEPCYLGSVRAIEVR